MAVVRLCSVILYLTAVILQIMKVFMGQMDGQRLLFSDYIIAAVLCQLRDGLLIHEDLCASVLPIFALGPEGDTVVFPAGLLINDLDSRFLIQREDAARALYFFGGFPPEAQRFFHVIAVLIFRYSSEQQVVAEFKHAQDFIRYHFRAPFFTIYMRLQSVLRRPPALQSPHPGWNLTVPRSAFPSNPASSPDRR